LGDLRAEMTSMNTPPLSPKPSMNVWSVSALGIGAMVGAGIFALLGQAVLVAHSSVWISFVVGGVIAAFSGYSIARLSARYPSNSGLEAYFNAAFPSRSVSAAFSLLYLITSAVSAALIAKSFGSYAAHLAFGNDASTLAINAFGTLIILVLLVLNTIGSGAVGRAELVLVIVKLSALGILLVAGASSFQGARMLAAPHVGFAEIIASVGLTYFAYSGYSVMANAAGSVAKPKVEIPLAIYGSIAFVAVLYVAISFVVLGNVGEADLVKYADTAVAQAAKPVLGNAGYVMVSIAALLATASAINASLFSSLEMAYGLGKDHELPSAFTKSVRGEITNGVLMAVGGILLMLNFLDLGMIAHIASAGFLISYLAVFFAHWRLAEETASPRVVIGIGFVLMAGVFVSFETSVYQTQPLALVLTVLTIGGAYVIERLMARTRVPTKSTN
jgi:amino acid transporter